jgi:uncharacterized protein YqeY
MSDLLNRIRDDLKKAMKSEIMKKKHGITYGQFYIIDQKTVSRAIISMFPEIGIKPNDATDDDTIKLLKRFVSSEKTRELFVQEHLTEVDVRGLSSSDLTKLYKNKITELGDKLTSGKIQIAESYLPEVASEDDMKQWIIDNINLSQFKNKMQAMGPIMKQFKGADGNIVKKILMEV